MPVAYVPTFMLYPHDHVVGVSLQHYAEHPPSSNMLASGMKHGKFCTLRRIFYDTCRMHPDASWHCCYVKLQGNVNRMKETLQTLSKTLQLASMPSFHSVWVPLQPCDETFNDARPTTPLLNSSHQCPARSNANETIFKRMNTTCARQKLRVFSLLTLYLTRCFLLIL